MSIFRPPADKFTQMTQTPIPRLVSTLAVPTIISMLVTSLYNMADTFFVGRIGTSATGAVGVVFSLMAVIQAVGFTFGHGSGNFISRTLGSHHPEEAGQMAATGFFCALATGGVIGGAGPFVPGPPGPGPGLHGDHFALRQGLHGLYPHRRALYDRLAGAQQPVALPGQRRLRHGGHRLRRRAQHRPGPHLHLRFGHGRGRRGPGHHPQPVGQLLPAAGRHLRGGNLRIRLTNVRPTLDRYARILTGGLPSFWRQALASVATVLLNVAAREYGDAAIAAMSIVSRITMFAGSALIGLGQGYQPVCGFNYGAKLYGRVRRAFFLRQAGRGGGGGAGGAGLPLRPPAHGPLPGRRPGGHRHRHHRPADAVRLLPLMAWFFPSSMTLQTIGQSFRATVLAMCRQGLFFLPAILILPSILGITGIQLSQPVSDLCSFLVALPMGIGVLRELRAAQEGEAARKG